VVAGVEGAGSVGVGGAGGVSGLASAGGAGVGAAGGGVSSSFIFFLARLALFFLFLGLGKISPRQEDIVDSR
jgi:hypothetical protein